jgi:hypothetical protein
VKAEASREESRRELDTIEGEEQGEAGDKRGGHDKTGGEEERRRGQGRSRGEDKRGAGPTS